MPANLFDANFYRLTNPDLANFNDAQALLHFQNYGLNEGRSFSPFVDLNFYRSSNSDLAGFNNPQALQHLQNNGVAEGRRFSQFADLNFYRAANSDLAGLNNEQISEHLQNYGIVEGRRFSQFFDLNYYASSSSDLVAARLSNKQLLEHFEINGLREGRAFSLAFNISYYRATYSDLASAGLNNKQLYEHFQLNGLGEGRASSQFFNVSFYRSNYPDLASLNSSQAYQHFVLYGQQEGRIGSETGRLVLNYNQVINGKLDSADRSNPLRSGSYSDDYNLTGVSAGQHIRINLSGEFDTYLQLVNASTGQIITFNDDFDAGTNSQLDFTVQSSISYIVRATSYSPGVTGAYSLTTSPSGFDNRFGYGLVNAATAVSRAINQNNSFPNVADSGGNNWNLDLVNAAEVWAQGYTGQGVIVAVVDTGVEYNHIDLSANIWTNTREIAGNSIDDDGNGFIDDIRGWNFLENNNNPMDLNSHGTHVAGTIAATNNGSTTPTGVAYNALIMPVRVLSANGSGLSSDIANGIRYAANNGARVINLSLGGDGTSRDIESAINFAVSLGSVVVMASGNSGLNEPSFPARYATTVGIAVGALDINRREASFSNRVGNTTLDYVMAPGVNIYSTLLNKTYGYQRGTSMAAPHVAGVAALMLSANLNLTPTQVESILTATASTSGLTARS